jgi:hypothetical protein
MAKAVLNVALEIGGDLEAGPVDKVVAWQAAHRVRVDLHDRRHLLSVQRHLADGLEDLGDLDAAYRVAETALAESLASQSDNQDRPEQDQLSAAVLRLTRARHSTRNDPLIDATIAAATASGAALGLEARIWAAIDLLSRPDQRRRALELTDDILAELSNRTDLGAIGNRWRLLLAFHCGRAGYPAITQQLLTPMLAESGPIVDGDAARAVLYAVAGPRADTRLQIIGLEAELQTLPPEVDSDRLRLHRALAADYSDLGDYRQALHHRQQELLIRRRIHGAGHRNTFTTRNEIAHLTGQSGYPAEALRQFQELLTDELRVLGPDDRDTLRTRSNIAFWTGESGNRAEALRLSVELLHDQVRVLGPDHSFTLTNRNNIAFWTAYSGRLEEALQMSRELLPTEVRVFGVDDRETLGTRSNIAAWTGESGDPEEALRLFLELLYDEERVLGPDHRNTLVTRHNIAALTGQVGHPAEALHLFQELLPDRTRILGPDHPDTLGTWRNIAAWAEISGSPAEALRLFQELLPKQVRVLGRNHPDTLATRRNIQRLSRQMRFSQRMSQG